MKTDLATTIVTAVLGVVIAYFVTGFFIPAIQNITIQKVDSSVTADLEEPNIEVFNYKSLNPTVEVYIGQCKEYNNAGECIDDELLDLLEEEEESIPEEEQETP